MKLRFGRLSLFGLGAALVAVLLSATAALAQDSSSSDGTLPAIFAGGMILFILIFAAAIYVYWLWPCQPSLPRHTRKTHGWRGFPSPTSF